MLLILYFLILRVAGLSLLIGLLSFPAGWDNDEVRGVCGPEAGDYRLGSCGVRWALVLAIIALCDTIILGMYCHLSPYTDSQ